MGVFDRFGKKPAKRKAAKPAKKLKHHRAAIQDKLMVPKEVLHTERLTSQRVSALEKDIIALTRVVKTLAKENDSLKSELRNSVGAVKTTNSRAINFSESKITKENSSFKDDVRHSISNLKNTSSKAIGDFSESLAKKTDSMRQDIKKFIGDTNAKLEHAQAMNSKEINSFTSRLTKENDLVKSELKHSAGNAWAWLKNAQIENSKAITTAIQNQKKETELMKHELKHETGNMKSEMRVISEIFNAKTMRNINANIGLVSSRLKQIEKEDGNSTNSLHSIDRRIGTIERRALEVEADYRHAKASAEELQQKAEDLKHTARLFMGQMDQFHSKTNAEFGKMVDIEKQLDDVQTRLSMIEDIKVSANSMENAISENARMVSELAKKLDYLERTSRKTIVLD